MQVTGGKRTVTVRQRTRRTILVAVIIVVMVVGLVTSIGAQPNTSGKISAAVFFLFIIALVALLWVLRNRGRERLRPDVRGRPAHREGERLSWLI